MSNTGHNRLRHPALWDLVSPLLPPLLSAQRASWEQGTAAQALLELYHALIKESAHDNHGDTRLVEHTRETLRCIYGLCHDAIVRASTDGRLGTRINSNDAGDGDGSSLDPACVGEAALFVLEKHEKQSTTYEEFSKLLHWHDSLEKMLSYLENGAPRIEFVPDVNPDPPLRTEGAISHLKTRCELWADGVYMGPPFLAVMALSDPEVTKLQLDERISLVSSSFDQIILYGRALGNAGSGLMSHTYTETSGNSFNPPGGGKYGRKAWGVGNGWFACGILRVLKIFERTIKRHNVQSMWAKEWLDMDRDAQNRLTEVWELLISLIDHILPHQRKEDRLFHNIIDDGTTFVEVNLAQMMASTIYDLLSWYDSNGRPIGHLAKYLSLSLDGKNIRPYKAAAEWMRYSAREKRDCWGFVQGVCGSPRFDKPGTAAEGQAWAIMMEVSRWNYLSSL
ncbi:hypothetical protein FQN50_008356 [Emmonsiellopsis sp. PD_5]|nr:hypothetical protein FQN50_008356 [Emmonsiellopsis sp. PD_5]